MIRRAACTLLACCLLVFTIQAWAEDAYVLTASWQAETDGMRAYLAAQGYEGSTLDQLATACTELLNCLRVRLEIQENRLYLAIIAQEQTLVDISVMDDGSGAAVIRSSMLPGIALQSNAASQAQPLTDGDLSAMLEQAVTQTLAWWNALPCDRQTEQLENVAQGTESVLYWELYDADVAVLVDALLSCLTPLLTSSGCDPEALRQQNAQIADENRYTYGIWVDMDAHQSPIGGDLVVWQGEDPIVSLVYESLTEAGDTEQIRYFGACFGWHGQTVEQDTLLQYIVEDDVLQFHLLSSGAVFFDTVGALAPDGQLTLETAVYTGEEGASACWLYALESSIAPSTAIPSNAGEQLIVVSSDGSISDESVLQSALEEGIQRFSIQALRLLPPEVLVYFFAY